MRVLGCVLLLLSPIFAGAADMLTRVFPVKCELFGGYTFVRPNQPPEVSPIGFQKPRTPFVAVVPDDANSGAHAVRQSAKAVLLNEGIPFPPGATASFHPQSGLLSVHNTPENLRHVQLFLESFERDLPLNISYLVTVVEGPGETIRQVNSAAASHPDCGKELSALLAAARQTNAAVRVAGDAFIESRSSSRTTFTNVQEHLLPTGMTTKAKNSVVVDMDLVESGLMFGAESWLETKDLKLTLEVNAPPSPRTVPLSDPTKIQPGSFPASTFWQSKLITSLSCEPGQTRLISVTKPLGAKDEDILWAVFVGVGSQSVSSASAPTAETVDAQENDVPSGLKQARFILPDGFLEHFASDTSPAYLQRWLECNGLEKAKGATASLAHSDLIVTNTQENLERVHGMLREMKHSLPGTMALTLTTIEAPAARLRDMTRAHVQCGDHAALWTALQSAVLKGDASYVDFASITADADCRATQQSGRESSCITDFSTNEDGRPSVDFEKRTTGSVIELEGWLPPDNECISVNLSHELQTGPAFSRRHTFKLPASGKPFEFTMPVLCTARTAENLAITAGTTRLVSLCQPTGKFDSDMLWATFLSCEVTRQVPKRQPPPPASLAKTSDPLKRETRVFQPPTGFFANAAAGWGPITEEMARQALKQAGITMPSDAEIHVSDDSTILRVTTTRESLDQIDTAFKKAIDHLHKNVVVTAHVFEGAGPFIREMAHAMKHQTDHAAWLTRLQTDAKIGKVKYVTTMQVGTQNQCRAQALQTRQMQQLTAIRPSGDGGTEFVMDMKQSGHLFEAEPKIHPGDDVIALSFGLETSLGDPTERQEQLTDTAGKRLDFALLECLASKLNSTITMNPGTTKLAWVYRPPESSEDLLHAVFFQCTLDAAAQ